MSVLSPRADVNRSGLSDKINPDVGQVRLTIQKEAGEYQRRSSRCPKSAAGHRLNPQTSSSSEAGHELQTCHFEVGSRGAVLAALRQRARGAPHRQEEKIQLLKPRQDLTEVAGGPQEGAIDTFGSSSVATPCDLIPGTPQVTPQAPPTERPAHTAATVLDRLARTNVGTDLVTTATCSDCPREEHRPNVVSVATQANDSFATMANKTTREAETKMYPVPRSTLDEARRRLRQIQRQKKVLNENMETLERARAGEVLRCQLEALAANSESSEQARIKKTVDAWIHLISRDVQAKVGEESSNRQPVPALSRQGAAARRNPAHTSRPISSLKGTESKKIAVAGRGPRTQTATRQGVPLAASVLTDGEAYLTRLYGRAPQDIKRIPELPLRLTVMPADGRPRPLVADSVRGAKLKPSQPQAFPSAPPQRQSSNLSSVGPTEAPSPAIAIPLAHPRIGPSPRWQQTVTPIPVTLSRVEHKEPDTRTKAPHVPDASTKDLQVLDPNSPEPPAADLPSQPSPVPVEVQEELALALESLPDGGLDVKSDSPVCQEKTKSEEGVEAPPPPSIIVEAMETEEDQEEVNGFPGTNFLSVANVEQESVVGSDPSVAGEEAVHLDGGPSPPPADYQGPDFPPKKHSLPPTLSHSCVPNLDDDMLNRMVQWVEQQLMTRLIWEQYPPPALEQKAQSDVEERSFSSDVADVAGGDDPQLLLGAGDCVDSTHVKNLVCQVLAEIKDQVLEPKDVSVLSPNPELNEGPRVATPFQEKILPVVPVMTAVVTPLPTPLPSPVSSIKDPSPLPTPPPSEPSYSPIDDSAIAAQPEPVSTPVPSPEQNLDEVLNTTFSQPDLQPDAEEDHRTVSQVPDVQEEAVPSPPRVPPHEPDPDPASGPSEDSSCTTSCTDSTTVTGSDTGLKLVSEGELLISFSHVDAMTEEASSSSSFQEDLDPPSEGQVPVHTVETVHVKNRTLRQPDDLSSGEVTHSTTPLLDGSGEAVLEATDESINFDPLPAHGQMLTSDLPSRPLQVTYKHTREYVKKEGPIFSKVSTRQSDPAEATPTGPNRVESSSDSSSDIF
ncbi:protein TALPID3 isoform X2 [Corythoichthys intestinalis]|uniref:protein TALPID3 isoform X2 n=1 Tax=Corythoichthys intestinalis TaxID=161448 RepID=UPI0025A5CA7F|nr:protein TALPID3 isoform X2 [Corythoichthys intestinalis]